LTGVPLSRLRSAASAVGARIRAATGPSDELHLAVYTDAPYAAGAEQSLATLLGGLAPEIRVTIVGVTAEVVDWLAKQRPGSDTAVLDPVRDKRDIRAILGHIRLFARLHPQILQVNLRHSYACQFAIAAGLLVPGTRVIAVEQFPSPPSDRLQLKLKQLTSRRLAAHVAVSKSSARVVESLLGLPEGRVRTIYTGIEDVETPSVPRTASSGPVVGAVGRFVPEKGLDVYLEALHRIPGVTGVLVGDGEERARIESLRDSLGLGERLELTGWRQDSREMMGSFDVLVVPSRVEPLGIVALEGMRAGIPVVASRVGGLAELVVDGETGVLVPPEDPDALADAIEHVLDPEVNRAMGEQGRLLVRRSYSQAQMARSFEDLYRSVLA
jgi:glycosyltransferase involved in cell wall biosynthesis